MSEIGIALFDLDDTLIDHSDAVEKSLSHLCNNFNSFSGKTPEELTRVWRSTFWKYWPLVISEELTLWKSRYLRFEEFFESENITVDPEDLKEITDNYSRMYVENVHLIDGVVELLEQLSSSSIQMGIISNTTREMIDRKLSRTGIGKFFSTAVSAQEIGKLKPLPELFWYTLEKAGYKPENAVFTGDSVRSDVIGARNAGISPVWFNRLGIAWPETTFTVPVIGSYRPPDQAYNTIKTAIS